MLGILHLSDIHFVEDPKKNPLLNRVDSIVDAVKNKLTDCDDLFIVVSGDIAFSGESGEYDIALKFFQDLIEKLKNVSKAWIRFFSVPGNHDCYFESNFAREVIVRQAERGELKFDQSIVDILCSTQDNYSHFSKTASRNWRRKIQTKYQSPFYSQYLIGINRKWVKLHCFNSASFSEIREKPGSLFFPLREYDDYIQADREALSISIIHHPLNWLDGPSHRVLRDKLVEISDLILTGHEHVPNNFKLEINGSAAKFLEAGALQESQSNKSHFAFIKVNLNSKNVKASQKVFALNGTDFNLSDEVEIDIMSLKTKRKTLEIKNDFRTWLEEIGAPIAHPRKEEVLLDDLFVTPDVQVIEKPEDDTDEILSNEHASTELLNKKLCAIVGAECAGKTTFLKKVFLHKYKKDQVPIYIDGSILKKTDFDFIYESVLKKAFQEQYDEPERDFYSRLNRENIVILIDNFGSCPLPPKGRAEMVINIKSWFGGAFITARELIHFDLMQSGQAFEDFNTRRLLELSPKLRKELISKWNSLGFPYDPDSPDSLSYKNVASVKMISEITQKHFIEPYPIYLITLLQVHDLNSAGLDHGSIGFYYEYLIKHSLQEAVGNKTAVNLYETFMKEFCYFLFDNRLSNINEVDFQQVLTDFTQKKRVTLNFSSLRDTLISANMIRIINGQVSLHQPYIYYYFAAIAISDRLEDSKIQKRVMRMLDRIYVQEFEGILLFLSHLSNNPFIMKALQGKCKEYFREFAEAELDDDIKDIEDTITNEFIPLLDIQEDSNEDRSGDPAEEDWRDARKISEQENDPDRDIDIIGSINEFVRAIKTFELMGNIAKINYSWDYEVKMPIVRNTYGLGLRLMSAYFEMMKKGADEVIAHVRQVASKKDIEGVTKLKDLTRKYTLHLAFAASYNIIRRMTYSFGHEQLRPIFHEISENEFSNAKKLIEFSVDLHQLGNYPEAEVRKYLSTSRGFNRPIARLILRNFVYEYTQLFKVDARTRQKIHQTAGIQLKDQRRIQATSKRIKK